MRATLLGVVALVFAATLVAPPAQAHALVFAADPLLMNIDMYPRADGKMGLDQAQSGSAYFPAYQPGSSGVPLEFSMPAPIRFSPAGVEIRLGVRADKPVYSQDTSGNSLRIELLAGGTLIPGASMEKPLPQAMKPNDASGVVVDLATNVASPIPEGGIVTVRVTPLMPALLDSALALVVGPDVDSGVSFAQAHIPSIADLRLQDTNLTQVDLARENFTSPDPNIVLNEIDVYHDNVTTNYLSVLGTQAYIEFKGAETDAEAQVYHDFPDYARRINATHDFKVGSTLARVHPGVGVVILADLSNGPLSIDCVKNCGPSPLHMTLYPNRTLQAPGNPGTPLISDAVAATAPPPTPAPVSGVNSAHTHTVPGFAPVLVMGLLAGLALVRRRRERT